MQNNGFYYTRCDRMHRDARREYPREIYPFGSAEIELFAHESDTWKVSEKKTGLLVARGDDMDTAIKAAFKRIDDYGRDKFVELIKDTLTKLNQGLEYDYEKKEWVDSTAPQVEGPEVLEGADQWRALIAAAGA